MYNAAVWLHRVQKALPGEVEVEWRNLVLQQINSKEGPEWKAWEQPESEQRSLPSLRGGVAARKQGTDAFDRYHMAMLHARHKERAELNDRDVVFNVARSAGLDAAQFERDYEDPETTRTITEEHRQAVEQHGVFGTPTFIFEDGHAAFLKTLLPPEGEEVGMFKSFMDLIGRHPYIGEIKHPQPPWPKGVYD